MAGQSEFFIDSGMRAHRAGDLNTAISAYRAALQQSPNDDKILFLLGNILLQTGDIDAATDCLQRAHAQRRNHPGVLGSLAQAYFEGGRYEDAENAFRTAVRLDPRTPQFQLGLANSLALQGKLDGAEILLKKLVSRFPDSAFAWFNLGNVARDQARPEQAVDHYRHALQLDPTLIDARNNLGSILHSLLRFEEAEREYRACMDADPTFVMARSNLASVLIDTGRFDEAETVCEETIALVPEFPNAHSMLAAAIAAQGRVRDALPHYRQATLLAPETLRFAETYAAALCESGDSDEGLRQFGNALARDPNALTTTQLVAPVLLSLGYFAEGWDRFRRRPTFMRIQGLFAHLGLTQTLPPALKGKHVCVLCEQGLGDELFFLRFALQLKSMGARITYCAGQKISTMLTRVASIDQVVTSTDDLPAADVNILVSDLPYALANMELLFVEQMPLTDAGASTLLTAFPWQQPPYAPLPPRSLSIPPIERALVWARERLASVGKPPYLGITWRGGTPPGEQHGKEWKLFKEIGIPQLAAALKRFPGTLLALQRNPASGEMAALESAIGAPVHDFTALNDDLEKMLALLALIDEYVGVSNTNMHLRAAAGRTARVVVPCPAEWRWMATGKSSPWFPGFSVYRQSPDGDWRHALENLQQDIGRQYPAA